MEDKEIIEVEVSEESIENPQEKIEDTPFSEEAFEQRLASTYALFLKQGEEYDDYIADDLHELLVRAKVDMDANSHMKLLYMSAKRYQAKGNRNACAYCAMRMKSLQNLYHGRKKKPRLLLLNPIDTTPKQIQFIQEETAFMEDFLKDMYRKSFTMSIFLFIVLFIIVLFVLKLTPVYALLEAFLMTALAYIINKLRLPTMFERKQLDVLAKHCEHDLLELDAPIRFG